jgi:hypothetical protein
MTSIVNLFSNFNDLIKPKSVTDNVTDYKAGLKSSNEPSPSLLQGTKFKKYQGKITNNLEKRIKQSNLVEGFEGLKDLSLNKNGLTEQTNNVLDKNNFTSQQQTITNLKNDYQNTLNEYQTLMNKITGNVNNYIDRINPSNPYLGKVIQLQGGALFYVTNQGVAKYISQPDVYSQVSGKNGFPPEGQFTTLSIPFDNSYSSPGATIPTKPPLVTGTPVEVGESVGNEGINVFVDSIVKNPQNSYVGCYNDKAPITEIIFVPKMNSSNVVNGFVAAASSTYQNNNNAFGAWAAFDRNPNDFWHSQVSAANNYNGNTGEYTGAKQLPYIDANGTSQMAKGEILAIYLPGLGTPNATNIPLIKYDIQGRQDCCGNPNARSPNSWIILGFNGDGWVLIDTQTNQGLSYELKTYTISNPKPYSGYLIIITNCGNPGDKTGNRYCVQISQWNLYTTSDYVNQSTSDYVNQSTSAMTNVGQLNFDQCQSYALNSGNKYFALQAVDANGVGNCMTSNDLAGSQVNGEAFSYTTTPLWASNTTGDNVGSLAILDGDGGLNVNNASGASIFSTPIPDGAKPSQGSYIGCYKMPANFAKQYTINGSKDYSVSFDDCQDLATNSGFSYFAVQGVIKGPNPRRCLGFKDSETPKKYGLSKNCKTETSGGSVAGNLYSTEETLYSYLYLQDDGNMCIFRGTGPNDSQSVIWCSETTGKQQGPNPNFAADKGKFGKNWIPSGSTLAPGDFIGSNDGSIYLMMQYDGNLVLYTSSGTSKCSVSTSAGNKTVGAQDTNALYQIMNMGNKSSIGKLAYIDQNSSLHAYPSDNIKYSNDYTMYSGMDSAGFDIPGASYGNSTVEQCQTSCNSNDNCAGFAFTNNVCFPKTSSMFPNGERQINANVNLYTRNKTPKTPPIGVPGTVVNIDSILYDNYKDGGPIGKAYGLTNATTTQKQQIEQLQSKLNMLTSQINGYTNKFSSGTDSLNSQSSKNIEGLGDYLKDFKNTNTNIKNFNSTNIENILNDSDITVLQKNYDYLFWSILAAGTVLVTMNIVKKQ